MLRQQLLFVLRFVYHERSLNRRYDVRTSDPDERLRSLYGLHRDASRDSRDERDVRDGTSTSGDDDGKHSNDANTNHVPSSDDCTTSSDNTPNTKASTMLPKLRSRTNRILPDGKRKQAL